MPFFSVIMPVYNVGETLRRTLQKVLAQSFTDYELILVDDGSTDRSAEICIEISKQHQNIRFIHQQNAGVSAARNMGLDLATGEYILFIDSDDELNYDQLFQELAEEVRTQIADMLVFSYVQRFYKADGDYYDRVVVNKSAYLTSWKSEANKFMDYFPSGQMFVVWNKVYRKEIIQQYHLRFHDQWMEDFRFILDYLTVSSSVRFLPLVGYIYNHYYKNSLSRQIKKEMLIDHYQVHQQMLNLFPKESHKDVDFLFCQQYYSDLIKYIVNEAIRPDVKQLLKSEQVHRAFKTYKPVSLSDKIMFSLSVSGHYRIYKLLRYIRRKI